MYSDYMSTQQVLILDTVVSKIGGQDQEYHLLPGKRFAIF